MFIWWLGLVTLLNEEHEKAGCPQASAELRVLIAAARKPRCVDTEVRRRWMLKVCQRLHGLRTANANGSNVRPDVARTWVTVRSMISRLLHEMWAAGGLMGTTPQEAFSVQCGLGSTMTAQDIFEGYMNVMTKLQMAHPAEFIMLSFRQQRQGGAG